MITALQQHFRATLIQRAGPIRAISLSFCEFFRCRADRVVERIDPGVLADLIIKATALQEMTNSSLRDKRSPYRINEISIAASIPPGVTFAIGRIDVQEETATGTEVSSADLVDEQPAGEAVISLDGTTLSQEQLAEVRKAMANDIPEDINRL